MCIEWCHLCPCPKQGSKWDTLRPYNVSEWWHEAIAGFRIELKYWGNEVKFSLLFFLLSAHEDLFLNFHMFWLGYLKTPWQSRTCRYVKMRCCWAFVTTMTTRRLLRILLSVEDQMNLIFVDVIEPWLLILKIKQHRQSWDRLQQTRSPPASLASPGGSSIQYSVVCRASSHLDDHRHRV